MVSAAGTREIPLADFFTGPKETALAPAEIATAVLLPRPPKGLRSAFLKIQRIRGHDLALVNAAASVDPVSGRVRLAVGSVAPTPVLVNGLDGACPAGASPTEVGERLAAAALQQIHPIDDVRASAEYRRDMTALLCRRLARILVDGRKGRR